MPRGHTLGRFPTPHPSVRRVRCRTGHGTRRSVRTGERLAAPYPPPLVADQGKPPETNASNPDTVESSPRSRRENVAPQFLCYKTLKKCLKSIPESSGDGAKKAAREKMNVANAAEPEPEIAAKPKPRVRALDALTAEQRVFVKTLNDEMKKFNTFFMNAEEDLVMRERVLATRFHKLVDKKTGKLSAATSRRVSPNVSGRPNVSGDVSDDAKNQDAKNQDAKDDVSVSAACEELRETRRAFADFHGELVLMEHWTSLNYTALVKILKKHDKRSSLRLRSPVLVSALQQPFYSTEVLTELIKKTEARFRVLHALASETEAAAREKSGAREPETGKKNASPSKALATTPAALARTRAAISCWDGMKHEDSVKRPFGDISVADVSVAEHQAPASKKVRAA